MILEGGYRQQSCNVRVLDHSAIGVSHDFIRTDTVGKRMYMRSHAPQAITLDNIIRRLYMCMLITPCQCFQSLIVHNTM